MNDLIVLPILVILVSAFICGWQGMHSTFNGDSSPPFSPYYSQLPYDAIRTTIRLLIGLILSMIFTIVFGVLAAKFTPLRRVILPIVNFMESVPLIGFLTFTTAFFLGLYPHSIMGLEGLAVFAIFTGQAWNMMLTLYQMLRIIPHELTEASVIFHCNAWQRFWRVEFLYSFPGLLWNTMVSQSAAWFALIASEMLTIGHKNINLPGIGSWIGCALESGNIHAVLWGLLALIINVVLFDQLLFRPLVRYASRFKIEDKSVADKQGSGKSTLLRIIAGLESPTAGSVICNDLPVKDPCPNVSMVFQSFALFPWLTVSGNIAFGLEALGLPEQEINRRTAEMIDLIGLSGYADAWPRELSGGMKQRIGFARALAVEPRLLLLDEPFSALDIYSAHKLRQELTRLWQQKKLKTQAMVLVTHNVEEAVMLCDRILLMTGKPGTITDNFHIAIPREERNSDNTRSLIESISQTLTQKIATTSH